jgi:uncharacterized lipoprotein NlpE involved in copper resistance
LQPAATILLCLLLGACSLFQGPPKSAAMLLQPPAVFAGDLPCADCAGIRTELELRADGRWFMRSTYLGHGDDATHEAMGAFVLATDSDRLTLTGDREPPRIYRVLDADTIRMLDLEGNEIDSTLNYALRRVEPYRALKIVRTE